MKSSWYYILILVVGCGPSKPFIEPNPHRDHTADFLSKVNGNYANKYGSTLTVNSEAKTFKIVTPITATEGYISNPEKYSFLEKAGKPVCAVEFRAKILTVDTPESFLGPTKRLYLKFKEIGTAVKFNDPKVEDAIETSNTPDGKAKFVCNQAATPMFALKSDKIAINSYSHESVSFGTSSLVPSDEDTKDTTILRKELLKFSKIED